MIKNIILLSSEITKGMKSYGPKAFVPIGTKNDKKPLIIKQINNILDIYTKNVNIYVVIGFEYEKFNKLLDSYYPTNKYRNIHRIYHKNYEATNNAYAMKLAMENIDKDDVLIIQNGILTKYFPKSNKKSTLPLIKTKNTSFNLGMTTNNDHVKYLCYDLDNKWAEILYLSSKDLLKVKQIINKINIKQHFLFELINLLIENNIEFFTENISTKYITKINNHKDFV